MLVEHIATMIVITLKRRFNFIKISNFHYLFYKKLTGCYIALLSVYVELHKYPGELKFKTKDGIWAELVNFRNYKNKLTCKATDVMRFYLLPHQIHVFNHFILICRFLISFHVSHTSGATVHNIGTHI